MTDWDRPKKGARIDGIGVAELFNDYLGTNSDERERTGCLKSRNTSVL
jgi:hypothetical protein